MRLLFKSSHIRFLEGWNPAETGDIRLSQKIGLFHDLNDDDSNPIESISNGVLHVLDTVRSVTPASMQKAIAGNPPHLFHSPQIWWHIRANLQARYPAQQQSILNLFNAYE